MIAIRSSHSPLGLARLGALLVLALPLTASETRAAAPPERYTTTTDTVLDTQTGLMWQRGFSGSTLNWSDAGAHCNTLTLAGFDDWRLPEVQELQTLVDYSVVPGSTTTIDLGAFPGTPATFFWSSSALAGSPSVAWLVNFGFGSTASSGVSLTSRVRCVR